MCPLFVHKETAFKRLSCFPSPQSRIGGANLWHQVSKLQSTVVLGLWGTGQQVHPGGALLPSGGRGGGARGLSPHLWGSRWWEPPSRTSKLASALEGGHMEGPHQGLLGAMVFPFLRLVINQALTDLGPECWVLSLCDPEPVSHPSGHQFLICKSGW